MRKPHVRYSIVAETPGGLEVLSRREFVQPDLGKGQVLVRHTAIGVNFLDIYLRTGLYPWPVEKDLVLGSEAAGVVEQVGSEVTGVATGDRVAYAVAHGAYASHRVIDAQHLVRLPESVDDRTAAAAMLKGLTAHYLLHHSYPVKTGDTVLFHAAAGGVGLIAGQWLASKGVTAIGTAGGAEKCALASSHGFREVIDYRSEDFVQRVMGLTGGAGVDAVYDSVGKDTYPGSLHCLKTFGTLVSFGQSSGPVANFKLADLSSGSFFVTRPVLFHFTQDRNWLVQASAELFGQIESGAIAIRINQTVNLEDAADAHRMLEGRRTTGSTVLLP